MTDPWQLRDGEAGAATDRRLRELEAEVGDLRDQLHSASVLLRDAGLHGDTLGDDRPRQAAPARPSLAASEAENTALRRANAELAEERRVLRASEERSRLAFSIAGACAWELDPTTGLSRWDTTARTLFGLPDVLPFVDAVAGFVHHNDLSSVHEAVAAALDPVGGGHYAVEHRAAEHLSASGTQWLQSLGQAYFEGAGAARRPVRLVCVTTDVTQRRAADERRALLVAELNHRVKNTLAIVQALAEQTRRATDKRSPGSPERRQFHADFQSRLLALARAHDLLTREEWQGTTLRDILATAAELFGKAPPHGTSPQNEVAKLEIDGPAVRIGPEATVTLTMGIHELATNAAKHGALSMPGGRVTVTWKIVPDRSAVDVLWAEAGGPPVAGPPPSERHGFGLRLLERGLARQLGGSVHLDFVTDGLRCRIRLPLSGGRVAQR